MNVNNGIVLPLLAIMEVTLLLLFSVVAWGAANISKYTDRQTDANVEKIFTDLTLTAAVM